MRLYHFTCSDHGARWIREDGEIRPRFHQVLGDEFAWFTPFASATARELGLTRVRLSCNRMEHRFDVDVDDAVALPWLGIRDQFEPWAVSMRESAPGAKPATWFLTRVPVRLSLSSIPEASDADPS